MTVVELAGVTRLDLGEVLRSRWIFFCIAVYALLAGIFVLVGLRESSVLGFTGMGRVLFSLCHALVVLLPLLALTATAQVVNRARDDGTLELLFSHPISRTGYLTAVTLVRYVALALPLALLMLALALVGSFALGQAIPWSFVGRGVVVSAALLWAFVGLGVAISVGVRNQARAMTYLLLAWAAGVALLDFALIGLMLQWRLNPQAIFILAAINPVQAARMALLAAAEPELSVLGPVGFYLANRLGSAALLVLGVVGPTLIGCVSWLGALRSFQRGDVV